MGKMIDPDLSPQEWSDGIFVVYDAALHYTVTFQNYEDAVKLGSPSSDELFDAMHKAFLHLLVLTNIFAQDKMPGLPQRIREELRDAKD